MIDFLSEANELFEYTQTLRRDFHIHPELGFQEVRTAGIVAEELNKLEIEVISGVGKTGVIGIIEGGKPGPVVLCRFDMDALPITEETGAEYASQTDGVMHACGHDGHTAMGLTVAKILHKHRNELSGTVKLVFQPAEEGLGGAEMMVKDGVLANPRPDFSLAMHLWNEKPLGEIGVTPGPAMSASETFKIKVNGKGAHGAAPHLGRDPVVAAAHIVTALQTVVSRNTSPLESAVVSATSIHGGTTFNVIPPEVEIMGTIRTYIPEIRDVVLKRVVDITKGIAVSLDCEAEIEIEKITPTVDNDPEIAAKVQSIVTQLLPQDTLNTEIRTMGSEDMAYMMEDIPGCYFFVGSNNSERGLDYGHHHPKFDFDEQALPRGVALMAAAAVDLLKE